MIWFLFASHCALGCLLALAFVPTRLTGGGFPRFISGVVLFFLLGALLAGGAVAWLRGDAVGLAAGAAATAGGTRGGLASPAVLVLYGLAAFPMAAGAVLREDRPRTRTFLLVAALVPALAAFVIDTVSRSGPEAPAIARVLAVASFLAAAVGVGAVGVGMILGHFYLVIPRLSIRPLVLLCRVLVLALAARLVFVGAAFLVPGQASAGATGNEAARFLWQNLAVQEGLIFWPRLLAGLLTPLILAFMAWRTARIRSTQSATGILYIAIVFTTIGEFLGRFLYLATGVPL